MLQVLNPTDAINDRVRAILVDTLYLHPTSLAIGALCGILASGAAAAAAHDSVLTKASLILMMIAVTRFVMAVSLPRIRFHSPQLREFAYEMGAYSYAAALGVSASVTVMHHAPMAAQLLMATNAVGYAVGIAARNAGRPAIALGQLFLTLVPLMIAALLQHAFLYTMLGLSIGLLLPAMASITLNVFKVLRDSVAAADTSHRLAAKMQILARTDVVTGLANRAGLNYELVDRLSALRADDRLALFWFDLDRFKEINDTLGHQVGDRLLAEVGARLQRRAPGRRLCRSVWRRRIHRRLRGGRPARGRTVGNRITRRDYPSDAHRRGPA